MKTNTKALLWFIISFVIFHIILFIMWGERQEYWYLYTGIMLFAGISYVFYQRDIASKRLLPSIGFGIITAIALIVVQVLMSLIFHEVTYTSLIKDLTRSGVYFKWQILVTLLFVIPCHELYMRTVLQKQLLNLKLPVWAAIAITALCSASLFFYFDQFWVFVFIFIVQVILSISYFYTRRIITTSIAQIAAVVLLLIFHG